METVIAGFCASGTDAPTIVLRIQNDQNVVFFLCGVIKNSEQKIEKRQMRQP